MSEPAKHTPGPWYPGEMDDTTICIWTVGADWLVGELKSEDVPVAELQANAALVAAAPDLLAELQRVEWGGTLDNQSSRAPTRAACCPCCGGLSPSFEWPSRFPRAAVGHTDECTLATAIRDAKGQS